MSSGKGIPDEDSLNLYTDGASFPHRKREAGVGIVFVWVDENGHEVYETYCPPGWKSSTSDEMELQACIEALIEARRLFPDLSRFKKILIFSDSMYVVNSFTNAKNVWSKRGWRTSNDMPAKNIPLWKRLIKESGNCTIPVTFEWIKGHKGHKYNTEADKLAKRSASVPLNKRLSNSTTTSKWSKLSTKRGCVSIYGQCSKIRIVSARTIKKNLYEYRYEVIDNTDRDFGLLDFVYCETYLSRGSCLEIRFNEDPRKPFISEVLTKLDPSEYKY